MGIILRDDPSLFEGADTTYSGAENAAALADIGVGPRSKGRFRRASERMERVIGGAEEGNAGRALRDNSENAGNEGRGY